MPSLRRCGLRLTAAGVGLLVSCFRTRHDLRPVGGMGRQHAMIAQVEAGPQTLALGPAISAVSLFVDSELSVARGPHIEPRNWNNGVYDIINGQD